MVFNQKGNEIYQFGEIKHSYFYLGPIKLAGCAMSPEFILKWDLNFYEDCNGCSRIGRKLSGRNAGLVQLQALLCTLSFLWQSFLLYLRKADSSP
jgi:hypothetical protein